MTRPGEKHLGVGSIPTRWALALEAKGWFLNFNRSKMLITHVAIRYKNKIYSLPKPNRHFHLINLIHKETGDINIRGW